MSSNTDDELEVPTWLSKEFLQNVLRSDKKNDDLEVTDVVISLATGKGDNFTSSMYRAKVEYCTEKNGGTHSCSFIIKVLTESDTVESQALENYPIFETEISMYKEALPEFERILSQHGDNTHFGPKIVYHSFTPRKVIIFEDLCTLGYEMIRERYMSMEELKSVLVKIAKFHAVSYSIGKSEKAEMVTKYKNGLYGDSKCFEIDFMSGGVKRFAKLLESNDELRKYLPYFQEAEKEVHQGCIDLYTAYQKGNPEDIFVINHGDFHVKNLMFKYDAENKFEDVMLIDFQFSVFGPSVIDFTYAVYMMFDSDTRLEKYDEMMRFYFDNFISTLKKINFKGKLPTYAQFKISQLKYRAFHKQMLVTILPMILKMADAQNKDPNDADMSEVFFKEDALLQVFFNPTFINEMKNYLPMLLDRGYLD